MMVWERETEEQATINDDDDDGAAAEMREKELTGGANRRRSCRIAGGKPSPEPDEIGRAHV